ncbi:hypothetical protein [Streptomyces wuyuanensis]|uniref:Uncharacterized protein n=1 Tax=Streptomyces wuyuanensis TaxID=1196353 RepID=A0A1G9WN80_9ACTN|nr:hypothetical protein [Streptomyces wuyuanensis]SDM85535.1 hypothetical protein SAMN05444921_11484 [Streptomyces wuyuanensis]
MPPPTPGPPTEAARAVATLAALADATNRYHRERARRPFMMKLDTGLSVELPGPAVLADIVLPVLNARRDIRNDDGCMVDLTAPAIDGEPAAVGLAELIDGVRAFIAALPEDHTAGRPYCDLRLFILAAMPVTVAGYLRNVADAVRRSLPRVVRAPRERRKQTPEERHAAKRAFDAATRAEIRETDRPSQEAAARYLLLLQERSGPGVVIAPKDLHKRYATAAASSDRVEPIGRNKFFEIADIAVGPRTRRRIDGKPQPAYVTREVPQMTREERKDLARLIVAKMAEDIRTDALAGFAALAEEQNTLVAAVNEAIRPAKVVKLRKVV